jgi:hypothetical protein
MVGSRILKPAHVPLNEPYFLLEVRGVSTHHAAFLDESRTRFSLWRYVAGNTEMPGSP